MSLECDRLGGINLAQGVCDTPVPAEVRAGAKRAVDDGLNAYTRYDGIASLRQAIAAKMKSLYGLPVDAETEVVASGGSTSSSWRRSASSRAWRHGCCRSSSTRTAFWTEP